MKAYTAQLDEGFSPLVQVGDSVIKGQPLAQKKSDTEQVVNIPQQLKVSLKSVKSVLKKNPGDPVKKGDIIAEKKGLLGMNNAAIISNVEGIVFRYERGTGNLVIRTSFDVPENVISPVAGTIALCDNDKIVVRIEEEAEGATETEESAASVHEDFGEPKDVEVVTVGPAKEVPDPLAIFSEGEAEGALFVLEKSFTDGNLSNALYDLTGEASDKIVLAKGFTREMLMKGVGIGVLGFISGGLNKEDLDFFVQREPKTPIIQVDDDTLERLKYWEGRKLKIEGGEKRISLVL